MAKLPASRALFNERSRYVHIANIRILSAAQSRKATDSAAIWTCSHSICRTTAGPKKTARPRPLTYSDFKLLVSPDNITLLEAADRDDSRPRRYLARLKPSKVGESARQFGFGWAASAWWDAQPYIWRDISKVNVVDYGMPCYLPVYERLLRRQEKTRAKLRQRYAEELAHLDARGQAALEAQWDRDMPLFPGAIRTPTWCSKSHNRGSATLWTAWFESLGLKGITTHQTQRNAGHIAVEQRRARRASASVTGPLLAGVAGALCELQQRQHDPAPAAGVGGRAGHG